MSNPYNLNNDNRTGESAQNSSQTNPLAQPQANPSAGTHHDGGSRAVDVSRASRNESDPRFRREGAPGPEDSTTRAHSQPQPGPAPSAPQAAPVIFAANPTSLTATASAPDVAAGMLPWEQWEDPMAGGLGPSVPSVTPIARHAGSTSLPARPFDAARVQAWAQGVDSEQSEREGGGAAEGMGQGNAGR